MPVVTGTVQRTRLQTDFESTVKFGHSPDIGSGAGKPASKYHHSGSGVQTLPTALLVLGEDDIDDYLRCGPTMGRTYSDTRRL